MSLRVWHLDGLKRSNLKFSLGDRILLAERLLHAGKGGKTVRNDDIRMRNFLMVVM